MEDPLKLVTGPRKGKKTKLPVAETGPAVAAKGPDIAKGEPPKKPRKNKTDSDEHGYIDFAKKAGPSHPESEAEAAGSEATPEAPPVVVAQTIEQERQPDRLDELMKELARAEDNYARAYSEAKSKQGLIKRTLGFWNVEKDETVSRAREAYLKAKNDYYQHNLSEIEEKQGKGELNENQAQMRMNSLALEIFETHDLKLQEKKIEWRKNFDLKKGWFSRKIENGWNKFVDGYRKIPFKYKIALSAALIMAGPGVGLLGIAGLGYSSITVAGLTGMRIAGGMASAKGTQELLQSITDKWRASRGKERMGRIQEHLGFENIPMSEKLDAIKKIIGKHNESADLRFQRMEKGDIVRRWIGMAVGGTLASGVASNWIRQLVGDWWQGGKGGAATPEGTGAKGATPETPGKRPPGIEVSGEGPNGPERIDKRFLGDTHRIKKGESIWKVTRDMYMQHYDKYEYSDEQARKLFGSFKDQGTLGRLGIGGIEDFNDLTAEQKHKIWAEWKTAKTVELYKSAHGGRIKDLVHPGDMVTLDEKGRIFFGDTSSIKAGYLHQEPAHGTGRASQVYEGRYQRPALVDQKWQAAKMNADAASAAHAAAREEWLAASAAEQAAIDNTGTHELMNFVQSKIYGPGTSVDWREQASEFRKRMLGSFLTSDQPMGPPTNVQEQQQYWNAAQEINRKLGYTMRGENVEQWVQRGLQEGRVTPEEIIGVFNRVVNG